MEDLFNKRKQYKGKMLEYQRELQKIEKELNHRGIKYK